MAEAIGSGLFNILATLLLAPLLEGVMRKFKAFVQSRQGPPVTQPYHDLLKLMIKEDHAASGDFVYRCAPVACLGFVLAAATLTPMGARAPLGFAGDTIVLLYLLTMSAAAVILGAMASGNPYAFIGAGRETMIILTVEPVLAITLLTVAVKSGSLVLADITAWQATHGVSISLFLAGLAYLLAIQAELAKLPFDIPEAETEIMEGPFIEHSGRKLAMYKLALFGKQVIFASLFAEIFFPWPKTMIWPLDILITLAKVFAVLLFVALVDVINPRLRIDQAINYFKGIAALALVGLIFAFLGI